MEVRISYNLIIEGVPLWLGDILLVKRKLLDPAHPQREETRQDVSIRGQRSWGPSSNSASHGHTVKENGSHVAGAAGGLPNI